MKQPQKHMIDPVTVVYSWNVKPGKDEAFQDWMHRIHQAAVKWPGHLGVTTLHSPKDSHSYQTVLRFDCAKHLNAWLQSKDRKSYLTEVRDLATENDSQATGLENWFEIPGTVTVPPPDGKWSL